jgi:hypothetical protein
MPAPLRPGLGSFVVSASIDFVSLRVPRNVPISIRRRLVFLQQRSSDIGSCVLCPSNHRYLGSRPISYPIAKLASLESTK